MRILIAEDDLISRNFLSKFLAKYGECDLVVDGLETIDAFLMALKEKEPYQLICLDIMMPKVDGVRTLKAIRDLEKQYAVPTEKRVKIIMTTALAEAQLVRTAFEYGCDAYAAKPIDTKKLIEVMEKLGLILSNHAVKADEMASNASQLETKEKQAFRASLQKAHQQSDEPISAGANAGDGYFKSVIARPEYQLEVTMETGTTIHFDFRSRLNTVRFGMLKDEGMFNGVRTDGNYIIFSKAGRMPVKITASEFMDLVLIDRRK